MTQPFPLYDHLSEISSKITQNPDWKTLSYKINSLTPEQCEIIYALIYHHSIEIPKLAGSSFRAKKESGPYGGKPFDGGKGILYTPSTFPSQLQNIISEYVKSL
jgi:hypothetical protein